MTAVRQKAYHDNTPAKVDDTEIVISDETRALFAQMAMAVPEPTGDASERIVLQILNATSWDDLDDPWDSTKAETLVDVELRIDAITRHPSSYAEGLGIFLVAHGVRMDTKAEIVFPTGSISIVAQLTKAYLLGAFPVYVTLRRSPRPTAKGYYPQHLEFTGSGGGDRVAG